MCRILTLQIILLWILSGYAQNEIVFFSDSPDGDELYDSSWGFETAPSELELAGNNDKFPVDTGHPFLGAHSLRLHWISNMGGDWGIAVASVGWTGHDITELDSLVYWINGPSAILQADLPDISLEDLSNHKSTKISLGNYFGGVDEDSTTWQQVKISLNEFLPGPENCDFTRIKTIFHWQSVTDGEEHIAWLDEIKMIKEGAGPGEAPAKPQSLVAKGSDSRIDLRWNRNLEPDLEGYYIYRAENMPGPYTKLNPVFHTAHLYSDFFNENNKTFYYHITAINRDFLESEPSDTVSATSIALSDDDLLTSIQEATFRYFYDYGHPVSGLARERKGSGNTCTSGGTGMGLMTMMVGAERGFETRDSIAVRILKILTFLQDTAQRYHGAWAHWINGESGETIPFSTYDDGGDLIETAFLIQGILTIRQYFDLENSVETVIRQRATQLWEGVEWNWYRRTGDTDGKKLYWHWSPNYNWQMNMPIVGFNEGMIAYLLAIASPTNTAPSSVYYDGWCGRGDYANGNTYYGYKQWVGWPHGGPLFFTHYSYLGFDPRDKTDNYCNYFENNRNISLINRAYCIDNPEGHAGYSELVWGLTASDNPWGYYAQEPRPEHDNGTITPTAAISAMPYIPQESKATLNHFYYTYGPNLWGEFGFKDAFNLDENWFANSYIAIDQGTIVPMIENYRTQLCWNMFMSNPEITAMLDSIGWVTEIESQDLIVDQYFLKQNYPNPFNPQTNIQFSLAESGPVTLEIFNILGKKVALIYNNKYHVRGLYTVKFNAYGLASGIYYYRIKAGSFNGTRKMIIIR
jgi:hypothetical protein